MKRVFENDDVILDKDEKTNEYRLSFFKDGHYKSEEHYPPYYDLISWANRLPEYAVFGIDWKGPQGWGRVEFVMPHEGGRATLYTEGMGPALVKELLNQLVDDSIIEE